MNEFKARHDGSYQESTWVSELRYNRMRSSNVITIKGNYIGEVGRVLKVCPIRNVRETCLGLPRGLRSELVKIESIRYNDKNDKWYTSCLMLTGEEIDLYYSESANKWS